VKGRRRNAPEGGKIAKPGQESPPFPKPEPRKEDLDSGERKKSPRLREQTDKEQAGDKLITRREKKKTPHGRKGIP